MSIDDIQLLPRTCHLLFEKSLVGDTQNEASADGSEHGFDYLGENQQQILFLVNDPENKFVSEKVMEMLSKLLLACNLSMADIVLVNYFFNKSDYPVFSKQFKPSKVLLFGVSTNELELPFDIPYFQIQRFENELFMTAPPLREFSDNLNLKKELWLALQKLFLNK